MNARTAQVIRYILNPTPPCWCNACRGWHVPKKDGCSVEAPRDDQRANDERIRRESDAVSG